MESWGFLKSEYVAEILFVEHFLIGKFQSNNNMSTTKKIAISGAAGNIAYQACFRIASGELLGANQTIDLQLLDIEPMLPKAIGVKMELNDCAFPLLNSVNVTADPNIAFADADYIFLFGAKPRTKGMERKDLLEENGKIFGPQGKAINNNASRDVRVLVIGNPANTNCLIAATNAPDVNSNQFREEIILSLKNQFRYEYNKKLLEDIQNKNLNYNDLKNFNSSNQVENILIDSITDNGKFSIDAVNLIYSLPEKSFVLINDALSNIYLAYIKNIIDENKITKNDTKNYLLKSNSELRDTLYSSYDIYLSEKYEIKVFQNTIERLKNNFR